MLCSCKTFLCVKKIWLWNISAQMRNGMIALILNYFYLFWFVTTLILRCIQVDAMLFMLWCIKEIEKKKIRVAWRILFISTELYFGTLLKLVFLSIIGNSVHNTPTFPQAWSNYEEISVLYGKKMTITNFLDMYICNVKTIFILPNGRT